MADWNCKKLFYWDEILYSGFFGVTDYESKLSIQKFKISDAISRRKMQKAKSYVVKVSL